MHIFCDESGGFDSDKHSLIITAAHIHSAEAARLMKAFRKAIKAKDEIKGGLLAVGQRQTFFDMLTSSGCVSAAISCRRASQLGGWVSNNKSEHEIYSHMLVEACQALMGNQQPVNVNIVADSGRYSKPVLQQVKESVVAQLELEGRTVSVEFANSASTPGVQVADIVSNSVYRATATDMYAILDDATLGALIDCNKLIVANANFATIKPNWIAAE